MLYIKRARIQNFDCFFDSGPMIFGPGMNVLVGGNNSGKSSLVAALAPFGSARGHRSPTHVPNHEDLPATESETLIEFEVDVMSLMKSTFTPTEELRFLGPDGQIDGRAEGLASQIFLDLMSATNFSVSNTGAYSPKDFYGHSDKYARTMRERTPYIVRLRDRQLIRTPHTLSESSDILSQRLARSLQDRVFWLSPTRKPPGKCSANNAETLASDSSNLPVVIGALLSNPATEAKLNEAVKVIFPQIEQIKTKTAAGEIEVIVWPKGSNYRPDLAISLDNSGSGVGHVLAILCAALFSPVGRIILIDEVQSHLHPGALKLLLELLSKQRRHQYILTTHSPLAITSVEVDSVHVCSVEDMVGHVRRCSAHDVHGQLDILRAVGANLGEVFGYDRVLWVEGASEEAVLPLIARELLGDGRFATNYRAVAATGDLLGKGKAEVRKAIVHAYARVPERGLLTARSGFLFDGDCRPSVDSLRKSAPGLPIFTLKRQMLENYLLDWRGIGEWVAAESKNAEPFSADDVLRAVRSFDSPKTNDLDVLSEEYLREIHGAKLLEHIERVLGEGKVRVDKVKRAEFLVKWLLKNEREVLAPLAEELRTMLDELKPKE